MRLGFIDFYEPQKNSGIVVQAARMYFLDTINDIAPEVAEGLLHVFTEPNREPEKDHNLKASLTRWAQSFNLNEPWVLEAAVHTMMRWNKVFTSDDYNTRIYSVMFPKLVTDTKKREFEELTATYPRYKTSFTTRAWNPLKESEEAFLTRAKDDFEAYISAYTAHIKNSLRKRGWQPVPKLRKIEHFEWLVRYQVQGWSHAKIAEHYQLASNDVVSKALNKKADELKFSLRPAEKGGRPPKNSRIKP
jgi:hypothetical protein